MPIDDGGPAYPVKDYVSPNVTYSPHRQPEHQHAGMTLLDWLAGMALSPTLVQAYGNRPDILATRSYEIADAMIAEKRRRDKEASDGQA